MSDNTNIWLNTLPTNAYSDFSIISIYIRTSENPNIPEGFRQIGTKGLCLKWDNNCMFVAMTPIDGSYIYTTAMYNGIWLGWKRLTPQSF